MKNPINTNENSPRNTSTHNIKNIKRVKINLKMPAKFCFSTLCSKSKVNKDYETIPYEQTVKFASPIRIQSAKNRARLDHLNKLKTVTTKRKLFDETLNNKTPNFQSTKLEQSKMTSTMIEHNAFTSVDSKEITPSLTNITEESKFSNSTHSSPSKSSYSSYLTNDSSEFGETQYFTNPSCASECFQEVNSSFFQNKEENNTMVYVCIQSYQPQFQGDIELKYTERVYVLHATEEFSLVKRISNQECGYVPSSSLTSFSSFIKSIC